MVRVLVLVGLGDHFEFVELPPLGSDRCARRGRWATRWWREVCGDMIVIATITMDNFAFFQNEGAPMAPVLEVVEWEETTFVDFDSDTLLMGNQPGHPRDWDPTGYLWQAEGAETIDEVTQGLILIGEVRPVVIRGDPEEVGCTIGPEELSALARGEVRRVIVIAHREQRHWFTTRTCVRHGAGRN